MKFERLNKSDLVKYCKSLSLETIKKTRSELLEDIFKFERDEIDKAISEEECDALIRKKIFFLANEYAGNLSSKISARKVEMESDENLHYLIYRVLGISVDEGKLIDVYQNTGRFLNKYAGSFLEEAATLCLFFSNSKGRKTKIDNKVGARPKTFEIDFLNGNDAVEIKWRDATTDGDHITKEHTRVKVIREHGYKPVLVRVQKQNELLGEAASALAKAMKTKQSKKSFLIQTNDNSLFEEELISGEFTLIKAPSLMIRDSLDSEKIEN